MKLSELKQLLQQYDQHKGWGRVLLGDALPIKILKEFITIIQRDLPNKTIDTDIPFSDYQLFAERKHYKLDFSIEYLNGDSASAKLFKTWLLVEQKFAQIKDKAVKIYLPKIMDDAKSNIENNIRELVMNYSSPSVDSIAQIVRERFLNQSDKKKALSPMRFWKQPDNLRDHCARYIACRELQGDDHYERRKLPNELNDLINSFLQEAYFALIFEKTTVPLIEIIQQRERFQELSL